MKAKVLFVCVENSCRSQMAEGFARALGAEVLQAASAGSKPSGRVDGMAAKVMREKGIDLDGHASKGFSALPQVEWDCVVSMGCGDQCPFVPAKTRLEWDIPDPKNLPIEEFRKACDRIEEKIRELIGSLPAGEPPDSLQRPS